MKTIAKKIYLALICIILYAPIVTLMVLSFNNTKTRSKWGGFTGKWYVSLFQNKEIMNSLYTTLIIALLSALIATLIGTCAALGMQAMNSRMRTLFMGITNIPMLNADIVTGVSLMLLFIAFRFTLGFKTILLAHITFNIPYVILSVMPKLKQTNRRTYEAALDLGASPAYAFFKVVLPDIMPGIFSGFLLSFTMSVDDFVITHFTRGAGINTLSTLIYSQVKIGVRPTLYALSTVIFITVLLVLVIVNFLSGSRRGKGDYYSHKGGITTKKAIVLALVFLVCVLGLNRYAGSLVGAQDQGQVYVYCFGDYIDPELVDKFEEETGYEVIIDYFDTNEEMYPVIKNSTAEYDVVCASDYMIDKMRKEGLLAEINFENVPNIENLTDNVKSFINDFDPGMKYSVPHTWGTYGIIYNVDAVHGEINSWKQLWSDEYAGEVIMPNSIREAFMVSGKILGYSMNTTDENELKEITDLLIEQKPKVYSYANDNARDLMIGDSATLAVITSGDVIYAMDENDRLDYVVPDEGSEVWTDCWAIPRAVNHKKAAEDWINFMLRGDIARINFEYLTYGIPNKEILDLTDNPILNPSDEILARCETLANLGHEADDLYSKYWKAFKAK